MSKEESSASMRCVAFSEYNGERLTVYRDENDEIIVRNGRPRSEHKCEPFVIIPHQQPFGFYENAEGTRFLVYAKAKHETTGNVFAICCTHDGSPLAKPWDEVFGSDGLLAGFSYRDADGIEYSPLFQSHVNELHRLGYGRVYNGPVTMGWSWGRRVGKDHWRVVELQHNNSRHFWLYDWSGGECHRGRFSIGPGGIGKALAGVKSANMKPCPKDFYR